ncbi:MAG: MFS transporter [Chloroflexi bacterium]|nr:MFS transporter [Chloroflexota bacterium]
MTSRQRWTLFAAVVGSGIVFLDSTIVNVALPRIGRELPSTVVGVLEGQTYVVSGYLAVLAALLILAGALSDHYGRRRIFAIGLASFGVTSVLCGLAPSLELLILARLLQGASGALLVPGSLAIITAAFSGPERSRAFGMWASATSALTVFGPIVGGILVDTIGWRVAFLINAPFIAIALWAAINHVEESRDTETARRFDWLGALVAATAVGGLAFGIIRGQEKSWSDTIAWVALGVGTVALIAFPFLMRFRSDPLVPLGLFRSRAFATINLATFFIYGALYVTFGYMGLLLQNVLGYTALGAGAVGLPVGVMLSLLSTRIGTLSGRIGARRFLVAGPLVMALGLLWFARLPASSGAWPASLAQPSSLVPPIDVLVDVLPATVLFGIGISLVVAPLTSALMGSIPARFTGLGSAINNALSRVGQPLLGAIAFVAISATFYSTLAGLVPGLDAASATVRREFPPLNPPGRAATPEQIEAAIQASIDAFHQAMSLSAGLLIVGAVIVFLGLREAAVGAPAGAATKDRPADAGSPG